MARTDRCVRPAERRISETGSLSTDGVDGPFHRHLNVPCWVCYKPSNKKEPPTMTPTTLGIDLTQSVFQLHGIDEKGSIVLRKKVRRKALLNTLRGLSPCLVGMEACAT